MRLLCLLPLLLLLAACRGTSPYTQQDLIQVRAGYHTVPAIYRHFRAAYTADNRPQVRYWHRREVQACRLNDVVDKRDTIDARTNLFAASVALDDLCNAMDSAYAIWAERHGYPYDHTIVPADPTTVFVQADADLLLLPAEMAHPAATT